MSYRYSKIKIDGFINTIWHKECEIISTKSSGPGGQNVNKRETKMQLSRDCRKTILLPDIYKERFLQMHATQINDDGILRLDAQVHRNQESNKDLLHKKLVQMIHAAFKPLKAPRKMTQPPAHAVDARIAAKKRRSKIRSSRTIRTSW